MDQLSKVEKVNTFNFEKSPAKEAYLLLSAHTPLELSNKYSEEDQRQMLSGTWDYNNPALIINKVKNILEGISPQKLIEEEKDWVEEILWFWYHHAISCALYKYKDKEKARACAIKALDIQPENHPNKITKLLSLLLDDKLEEARKWAQSIEEESEKSTAQSLITEWS
jgi:hypothetical protein